MRTFHERGKLVTAICHGPWVLISAGIMQGVQATGYATVRDGLIHAGAEFMDVPAARDGKIITGRLPDDLPEICREIIEALCERASPHAFGSDIPAVQAPARGSPHKGELG